MQPIDLSRLDPSEVRVGTRVELSGSSERLEFTVLGPWESDPGQGILSYLSDLGQALLGLKTGDRVLIDGDQHKVVAIECYREAGSLG